MTKTLDYLQNRMSDIIQEIDNSQDLIASFYSDDARMATANRICLLQQELLLVKDCIAELQ